MAEISTKPYLIRAIYEWCTDAGHTPYIGVKVDEHTRVPIEYVKNGEIVLSISMKATRNLSMGNELIQFSARFNGVSREIAVPIHAVVSVFARETGQGMFFEAEVAPEKQNAEAPPKPLLQPVPNARTEPESTSTSAAEEGGDDGDKPKGRPRGGGLRVVK